MEVPMIVSNVIGCIDAVVDGLTGQIVLAQDAAALTIAIRNYLESADLRREHGHNSRQRVLDHFQRRHIWSGLYAVYHELLSSRLPAARLEELRIPVAFRPESP